MNSARVQSGWKPLSFAIPRHPAYHPQATGYGGISNISTTPSGNCGRINSTRLQIMQDKIITEGKVALRAADQFGAHETMSDAQ